LTTKERPSLQREKSRDDLTARFFIHMSKNYASVRSELWESIKKAYQIERGIICGVRWTHKDGEYGQWCIQAYRIGKHPKSKVLGELDEVWKRISKQARTTNEEAHS